MEPESFFNRKEIWALLGTVFGFALNEASRRYNKWRDKKNLKKAFKDELNINYFQLEHKKDTLNSILKAISEHKILPGTCVAAATAIYKSNVATIIMMLKPVERDMIQNIYSRLDNIDNFLNSYEKNIIGTIKDGLSDPWTTYLNLCSNIIENCSITQELIKALLENKQIDIYSRNGKTLAEKRIFGGVITSDIIKENRK